MISWDESVTEPAQGFPPGWAWRTYPEDLWQELLDDEGAVVATIDWGTSPTEYAIGGETHVLSPDDWCAQPGGNVVVADVPDVRAVIAERLGISRADRREWVGDVVQEAVMASKRGAGMSQAIMQDASRDRRRR